MKHGWRLGVSEPDGLDLGDWGSLTIVDRQHLGVRTPVGQLREIDVNGLLDQGTNIAGWFDPEFGVAVLAGPGSTLVRLDLTTDEVTVLAELQREPDHDLRFMSFHPAGDSIVALYESGVVCLTEDGWMRWRAAHDDLSAAFAGVRDGAVWFATQWPPDRVGYRFAFRLADGRRVFG